MKSVTPARPLLHNIAVLVSCTWLQGACVLEAGLGESQAASDAATVDGNTDASPSDSGTDAPPVPSEICDDNLDNDGDSFVDCQDLDCSSSPACGDGILSIFVTSRRYPPTFNGVGDGGAASGEERADNICNHHAQEAGLSGDFAAWVGSSTRNPIDLITSAGPWLNTEAEVIFDSRIGTDNSIDKVPLDPIGFDENGDDPASNYFWTGTRVGGTAVTERNCLDWTTAGPEAEGLVGSIQYTDYRWTGAPDSGAAAHYWRCDVVVLPLLCIEK